MYRISNEKYSNHDFTTPLENIYALRVERKKAPKNNENITLIADITRNENFDANNPASPPEHYIEMFTPHKLNIDTDVAIFEDTLIDVINDVKSEHTDDIMLMSETDNITKTFLNIVFPRKNNKNNYNILVCQESDFLAIIDFLKPGSYIIIFEE